MANTVKVRRHGISRRRKKNAFRAWLETLPRKFLTYAKKLGHELKDPDGEGWTAEDFTLEANVRGISLRIGTVFKWCTGTKPRDIGLGDLQRAFKKEKIPF